MRINRLLKRDEIEGFDSAAKPVAHEPIDESTGEPAEPAKLKPVFGRRTRRHRRAL